MRVRCVDRTACDVPFKLEAGREYVVLALEAYAGLASAAAKTMELPAGLWVFVGTESEYVWAPITCFQIVDAKVSPVWRLGSVRRRWLVGYPLMLDEAFQIGFERGDEPLFLQQYKELMREANDEALLFA
jgi:hypothetical protein